jgi:hypothetical protein
LTDIGHKIVKQKNINEADRIQDIVEQQSLLVVNLD